MVVDFSFKRSPRYRVAFLRGEVPWTERSLRAAFRELETWAKQQRLPTGKWIISSPSSKYWEACVEIKRDARGKGRIHVKVLPAATVATVTFDPTIVSPRVIYHGLMDWLKWRRKAKEITSAGATREIYSADPWSDARAWSRATVEYIVRR
jgi:effector-binding domain-containing protein